MLCIHGLPTSVWKGVSKKGGGVLYPEIRCWRADEILYSRDSECRGGTSRLLGYQVLKKGRAQNPRK